MRLDLYQNLKGATSESILEAIGLMEEKIPRIRGVGIEDGKILIHTRTGGGNRESYGSVHQYIHGDYGIDEAIENCEKALLDYEDYRWKINILSDKDFDDYKEWLKVPYEATYRYPETDEEWKEKEDEILESIESYKKEAEEVKETKAYTNEYMTSNKYFLYDEDDDFDCTYANFWFEIPEEFRNELMKHNDPVSKALFGDAKDYIEAFIGGNQEAKNKIIERVKKADEEK